MCVCAQYSILTFSFFLPDFPALPCEGNQTKDSIRPAFLRLKIVKSWHYIFNVSGFFNILGNFSGNIAWIFNCGEAVTGGL